MSGLKYFYFPVIRQSSDLYSYVNVAYFYTIENWYILSLKEPGQLLKWHKNLVYELVLWELTHQVLSPNSASSAGLHKILTKKKQKIFEHPRNCCRWYRGVGKYCLLNVLHIPDRMDSQHGTGFDLHKSTGTCCNHWGWPLNKLMGLFRVN